MLDAYTVRKAIPRIVVAVIAINLSIYLCVAALDITTVVGKGVGQILVSPFVNEGSFKGIGIEANTENTVLGALGAGGAMAGIAAALYSSASLATLGVTGVLGLFGPTIITVALVALAILFTLVIWQALVIFLTVISPVAIACYILPGTEKYFKQWWDLYFRTLLVYPIIAVVFAMGNVMGAILLSAAPKSPDGIGVVQLLAAVVVIFAPLVLIPFSFKLAGGLISQVANIASTGARTGAKRAAEFAPIKRRREVAKRDFANSMTQRRATLADGLKERGSKDWRDSNLTRTQRLRRRVSNAALKSASGVVGGYNIEAQASALRAQTAKELNDQIATGRDEEIRALSVNKRWADRGEEGVDYRVNEDGVRQYRTLGGAWVNEADVDAAHARWGDDAFAQQTSLSYEMRKATTEEEVSRIKNNYANVAMGEGGWGLSRAEAGGSWIGAAFENQNQNLSYKYTDAVAAGGPQLKLKDFVTEMHEKRGSYQLAQMNADTIRSLRENYDAADEPTKKQIASIAESFVSRYGGGESLAAVTEDGQPITKQAQQAQQAQSRSGGKSPEVIRTNTPGAASVAQEVRELARVAGVLRPLDPSTEIYSHNTENTDIPRQS